MHYTSIVDLMFWSLIRKISIDQLFIICTMLCYVAFQMCYVIFRVHCITFRMCHSVFRVRCAICKITFYPFLSWIRTMPKMYPYLLILGSSLDMESVSNRSHSDIDSPSNDIWWIATACKNEYTFNIFIPWFFSTLILQFT